VGWTPLVTLLVVLGVWTAASISTAWLLGRWFRWLRGDFDPPPH
jgi:hypothetical protein